MHQMMQSTAAPRSGYGTHRAAVKFIQKKCKLMNIEFKHFFEAADEDHVRREKAKAKEFRNSQWWKNVKGCGECSYCKSRVHPSELTMDHRVPIIRGGRSIKGNLVPCCKECNEKKKYMLPIEWNGYIKSLNKRSAELIKQ